MGDVASSGCGFVLTNYVISLCEVICAMCIPIDNIYSVEYILSMVYLVNSYKRKWRYHSKRSLDSATKSLPKTSSSLKTLWYECTTPWILSFLHVRIIAIGSAIIVVAFLKNNEIVDLPV